MSPEEPQKAEQNGKVKEAKRALALLSNAIKLQCQAQISISEAAGIMKKDHPGAVVLLLPSININEKQTEALTLAMQIIASRMTL